MNDLEQQLSDSIAIVAENKKLRAVIDAQKKLIADLSDANNYLKASNRLHLAKLTKERQMAETPALLRRQAE